MLHSSRVPSVEATIFIDLQCVGQVGSAFKTNDMRWCVAVMALQCGVNEPQTDRKHIVAAIIVRREYLERLRTNSGMSSYPRPDSEHHQEAGRCPV